MAQLSHVLCPSLWGVLLFAAARAEVPVPCKWCLGLQKDVDQDDQQVLLLQRKGLLKAKTEPSRRLAAATPIVWVHVPKCGSSFLNTLVHLPGICPGLPDDLYISKATFGNAFLDGWLSAYDVPSVCPGLKPTVGHNGIEQPIGLGYAEAKGHFMVMLRQPEERLLSAYHDLATALPVNPRVTSRKDRSWGDWPVPQLPSPRVYARYSAGCATRMLTRGGWACGGRDGPPTPQEVVEAVRRLNEGFAFVGLTDEWALSICLLSRMFKVPCQEHQFSNTRPGPDPNILPDTKTLKDLKGFKDPYDGTLYVEAQRIFYRRLARYNVSEASCVPCWQQAGLLKDGNSLASVRAAIRYEDEDVAVGVNVSRRA